MGIKALHILIYLGRKTKIWHILPFNGITVGLLHTMKFFKSFAPSTLYKCSIVGLRVTAKYDRSNFHYYPK